MSLPPAAEGCVASLVHGAGSGKASPEEGGTAKPAVGAGGGPVRRASAAGGGGSDAGTRRQGLSGELGCVITGQGRPGCAAVAWGVIGCAVMGWGGVGAEWFRPQ